LNPDFLEDYEAYKESSSFVPSHLAIRDVPRDEFYDHLMAYFEVDFNKKRLLETRYFNWFNEQLHILKNQNRDDFEGMSDLEIKEEIKTNYEDELSRNTFCYKTTAGDFFDLIYIYAGQNAKYGWYDADNIDGVEKFLMEPYEAPKKQQTPTVYEMISRQPFFADKKVLFSSEKFYNK
jgi:hypothetical protein